ncbi:MAG: hypothetical protein AAF572_10140 [Cyanobacteria bacterium P01_B01_bin.77]
MVSTLQHLFLDIQGDNQGTKPGGEPIHRVVTLHNRGDRAAYLELWVEAADQHSAGIVQWVNFDKSESDLTLAPHQSLDVTLTITVPLQAEAGFYGYDIRMRSSQYPGEDVQRNQQLHILPSEQEARLRSEPHLTVTPVTDSEHPHVLKSGATLDLSLTVDNPSRRTDRFFLHCDNLPSDWLTIQYPESDAAVPGVVTFTDGLQLNPRESGQITVTLHPPQYSPAGSYYPTLRLTSRARPEITLLKIVYFTLEIDERLTIELMPKTLSVPLGNRYFDVVLYNRGNIDRQLRLQGWDPDRLLHYRLQPTTLQLTPGENATLQLFVNPRHWWQKIWRLKARTIEFDLLVENTPNDGNDNPALPHPLPTGAVNLKARRRWLFWLLLLATITTASLGLLALAWHMFVWRPSLIPKITKFSTTQDSYQEGKPEPIAFRWEITNPKKIQQVVLSQDGTEIFQLSRIFVDIDENFLPEQFDEKSVDTFLYPPLIENGNCSLETGIDNPSPLQILLRIYRRAKRLSADPQYLKCRTIVPTDFLTEDVEDLDNAIASQRQPKEGSYEFKLQVFTGKGQTNDAAAPTTVEKATDTTVKDGRLASFKNILGWGEPKTQQLADKAILETVTVAAADPPEILEFKTTQTEYRTVSVLGDELASATTTLPTTTPTTNESQSLLAEEFSTGSDTDSQDVAPENLDPQLIPIKLDWQISNPADIRELRLTSLSPEGAENTKAVTYPFLHDQDNPSALPNMLALEDYCSVLPADSETGAQILQCNNVPTQATQVGDYVFYLTVVTMDGNEETPILQTTPTVSIKPPAPAIVEFSVNGKSVKETPRQVYVLNPARGKIDITLNWDVQHAQEVELLPAPGKVVGNQITYTLSAAPGAETITLRGVNELEEEVTQSVIIEKVGFVSGAQPIPIQSSRRSPQTGEQNSDPEGLPPLPPPPTVLPVPEIAPIRTPPQAN